MTKLFLKHLAKNVAQVVAFFGIMYSFAFTADRWLGVDPIYGLLAFLILMFVYFLTERSWDQAKRDQRDF